MILSLLIDKIPMKPKEVLPILKENIGLTGIPVRLKDAIDQVLQDKFGLPPIQAIEIAEKLEETIRELIDMEEANLPYPILTIITSAEHMVSGYCFEGPLDTNEVKAAKRRPIQISLHYWKKLENYHFKNLSYLEHVFSRNLVLPSLKLHRIQMIKE